MTTMPSAEEIKAEVAATQPAEGTVALWWLGQASVLLKGAGAAVYIDPFFSQMPERLVPPPFTPEDAPPADLVLVTHDHLDHLDDNTLPGLAQSSPDARFVVPAPKVSRLTGLGIPLERVVRAVADEPLDLGNGVGLVPVPAMHAFRTPPAIYDFERDEDGHHTYLGYVIDFGGVRVYHAGDTLVYDGMVERLQALRVDLALLPINGRGYFREHSDIAGNTDEREAAQLAAEAGARVLVPIHYDMFAANLGRPGVLVEYVRERHPELTCVVPAHGRRFIYAG
ncbi:MAG: MBL fold metallo-hydrolase [Chloroflexota bacterium]|nr:MBL fold metallo-hydrolase [Chloroflexota bacterium]